MQLENKQKWEQQGDAKAYFSVLYQTRTTKESELFVLKESPNLKRTKHSTEKQLASVNPLSLPVVVNIHI